MIDRNKHYSIEQLQGIRETTLNRIFFTTYRKLLMNEKLSETEQMKVVRLMAKLFVLGDTELKKLAYFMSIKYAISTGDLHPLKDMCSKLEYYPVMKKIEAIENHDEALNGALGLSDAIDESLAEAYKIEHYCSKQQYELYRKAAEFDNVITVAPTSYGKTEILIDKCLKQVATGLKTCVITPSRSLLIQTLGNIIEKRGGRDVIITHPEMLTEELSRKPHLALLTQERLMAILTKKKDFSYDYIFVDEAHNIFNGECRADILTQALLISSARNKNIKIDFYTPFSFEPETSFKLINEDGAKPGRIINKVTESMKVPQFFEINDSGEIIRYDQFFDKIIGIERKYQNPWSAFLETAKNSKVIIYVNKPSDVENVANSLFEKIEKNEFCDNSAGLIKDAKRAFSEQAGTTYNLNKLISKGIFISHGKMLDLVKNHSEYLFREIPEAKFMITTSTLLEGVNIPADKLVLFDYKKGQRKLTRHDFLNLVGRIGRFNRIFSCANNNLESLMPQVYIMKSAGIMKENADVDSFLSIAAGATSTDRDEIKNPLLSKYKGENANYEQSERIANLCNIDPQHKNEYLSISQTAQIELAKTEFGKICYSRGVNFFDIINNEIRINRQISVLKRGNMRIDNGEALMECIKTKILANIDIEEKQRRNDWIYKIEKVEGFDTVLLVAINERAEGGFYYAKAILRKIKNWMHKIPGQVYVGKMGDCDKNGETGTRWREYHYFSRQDDPLIASYAMGIIKENADDIDFYLMPIIEVLNDMDLVDESFYNRIKYGTEDTLEISLIKAGADLTLAKKISGDATMRNLFYIDGENIVCRDKEMLIRSMRKRQIPLMYINSAENLF